MLSQERNLSGPSTEQNGDNEKLLEGQIQVQARPSDLVQPEDPVMFFDLSEEELRQVSGIISQNLMNLSGSGM